MNLLQLHLKGFKSFEEWAKEDFYRCSECGLKSIEKIEMGECLEVVCTCSVKYRILINKIKDICFEILFFPFLFIIRRVIKL